MSRTQQQVEGGLTDLLMDAIDGPSRRAGTGESGADERTNMQLTGTCSHLPGARAAGHDAGMQLQGGSSDALLVDASSIHAPRGTAELELDQVSGVPTAPDDHDAKVLAGKI